MSTHFNNELQRDFATFQHRAFKGEL